MGPGPGYVHGATDDFGYGATEKVVRIPALHATRLHVLGLDHVRLSFPHKGRADTLTDVAVTHAEVVRGLLS